MYGRNKKEKMIETLHLAPSKFYHIYNRGNNRENIFIEEKNYDYFLRLWDKHISPVADTYAYCLLKNHFHVLVMMKTFPQELHKDVSLKPEARSLWQRAFSNFFNAYSKSINKAYNRTGKLFEERFKRKEVLSDSYFTQLIYYIHANPQRHGFVDDFRGYPHSSYNFFLNPENDSPVYHKVLSWFGGVELYEKYHSDLHLQLKKEREFAFDDVD